MSASKPPAKVAVGAPLAGPLPLELRPEPALLAYFGLVSLLFGPFFLFAFVPLWMKYRTLRYEIDEQGITMRWGTLFRKEVSLTFGRIQDIQLSSNLVQRWMGLARVEVQTASGASDAEMRIEGLADGEGIRDFLYARMRGSRDAGGEPMAELAIALRQIAEEVRGLRLRLPAASPDA